jgi:hypothetical protein
MTTIKGYKLVCELCGCQSEDLWEIEDPDSLKIVSEAYHKDYNETKAWNYSMPYESFHREIHLPKCWQSTSLTSSSKDEDVWYFKTENPFLRLFSKESLYKKSKVYDISEKEKHIYFCCKAHQESYDRLKENCDGGWK